MYVDVFYCIPVIIALQCTSQLLMSPRNAGRRHCQQAAGTAVMTLVSTRGLKTYSRQLQLMHLRAHESQSFKKAPAETVSLPTIELDEATVLALVLFHCGWRVQTGQSSWSQHPCCTCFHPNNGSLMPGSPGVGPSFHPSTWAQELCGIRPRRQVVQLLLSGESCSLRGGSRKSGVDVGCK